MVDVYSLASIQVFTVITFVRTYSRRQLLKLEQKVGSLTYLRSTRVDCEQMKIELANMQDSFGSSSGVHHTRDCIDLSGASSCDSFLHLACSHMVGLSGHVPMVPLAY